MAEFMTDEQLNDDHETPGAGKDRGFNLVPGNSLNLQILKGELDASNKVSYAEWSRDAKTTSKAELRLADT